MAVYPLGGSKFRFKKNMITSRMPIQNVGTETPI